METPIFTWNMITSLIIIPIGLFVLFQSVKRLLRNKDEADTKKDETIATLIREKEAASRRENEIVHSQLIAQIEDLQESLDGTSEILFKKLEDIYVQLKVANGRTSRLESAQASLQAVHDTIHDERMRRRATDPPDKC